MTFLNLYNATNNNTYLAISEEVGNYLLMHVLKTPNGTLTAWGKSVDYIYLLTSEN